MIGEGRKVPYSKLNLLSTQVTGTVWRNIPVRFPVRHKKELSTERLLLFIKTISNKHKE